jgi:hypothetical protein
VSNQKGLSATELSEEGSGSFLFTLAVRAVFLPVVHFYFLGKAKLILTSTDVLRFR